MTLGNAKCSAAKILILLSLAFFQKKAAGGWLGAMSLELGSFSFQPEEHEPTPNYFSVGPAMQLGFSWQQVFDTAVFASYAPGSKGQAIIGEEQAHFVQYGAAVGVRVEEQVYFSIRGGEAQYRSIRQFEHAVDGAWQGPVFGFSIGGIHRVDKEVFWQICINYNQASVEESQIKAAETKNTRVIDQLGLSLTYVFNGFVSRSRRSSIF